MTRKRIVGFALLAAVVLLGALTVVVWRQSEARAVMAELDATLRRIDEVGAMRGELVRQLAAMEARPWVEEEAGQRLGMRPPEEDEIVIIAAESP